MDAPLTRRELELWTMLAGGATRDQVLHAMGISWWTYRNHMRHVYEKTGGSSREDVYRALGWLRLPEEDLHGR